MKSPLNRFKAGAIHLALSVCVAAAIFLPIYFIWYPGVLFDSAGGKELFLLIASVDLTLGPIITTVVYRHGKRGMKFDLAVIALMQLAALGYGVSVLFEARPAFIVFVKDRFELVRATQVSDNDLGESSRAQRGILPVTGPRLVAAKLPSDPDLKFKLAVSSLGGMDVQSYPQFYVPYDTARDSVRRAALPMSRLRKLNPGEAGEIDRMVARLGNEAALGYLPLRAGRRDLAVVVSKQSGDVLAYVAQRPWEY